MPVIPPGIPQYHVQKPCTMGDQGIPSLSIMIDVQRVFNMIHDERHLTAHSLYTSILHRIQVYDDGNTVRNDESSHNGNAAWNDNKKQKSKTFSAPFIKRSGPSMKQQQQVSPPNGTSKKEEDDEMKQVKDIIFKSKKHIFDKLEVCICF